MVIRVQKSSMKALALASLPQSHCSTNAVGLHREALPLSVNPCIQNPLYLKDKKGTKKWVCLNSPFKHIQTNRHFQQAGLPHFQRHASAYLILLDLGIHQHWAFWLVPSIFPAFSHDAFVCVYIYIYMYK